MCEKPSNYYLDFCTRITDNIAFTTVKSVKPELVIFNLVFLIILNQSYLHVGKKKALYKQFKNRKLLMHV